MDFSDISVKLFLIGFLFSFYLVRGQVDPKSSNSSDPTNATSVESPSVESPSVESPSVESLLNESLLNEALLKLHNEYREIHSVGPLALNSNLSELCQAWANVLAEYNLGIGDDDDNQYGQKSDNPYGQNSYWTDETEDPNVAVKAWYDEEKYYDYYASEKDNNASGTGHFSQVVWKSTKYLGCGYQRNESNLYVVCNYDPKGIKWGSFQENVLKPKHS